MLIELKSVTKFFTPSGGVFRRGVPFAAVDDVSLNISRGRSLGIVGESGSGKTTIARMICGVFPPDKGSMLYNDKELQSLDKTEYEQYRKAVQMVFQDPYNSLNPKLTIESALSDGIMKHISKDRAVIREKLDEVMQIVGLPLSYLKRYPHEFSGGQRQRISIARALSLEPELIIADEPVSSLDVSVQAQILNLMNGLKQKNVTFVLISHSLAVVSFLCDDIAVMNKGCLVEYGETEKILNKPETKYTTSLLEASKQA